MAGVKSEANENSNGVKTMAGEMAAKTA